MFEKLNSHFGLNLTNGTEDILHQLASIGIGKLSDHEVCEIIHDLQIDYGTQLNEKNHQGKTPLHIAIEQHRFKLAQFFLNSNNKLQLQMDDIRIILNNLAISMSRYYSAQFKLTSDIHSDIHLLCQMLFRKIDINQLGPTGNSLLHEAVVHDQGLLIKLLILFGADKNLPNTNGLTAIELEFKKEEYSNQVIMLQKHKERDKQHNKIVLSSAAESLLKVGANLSNTLNKENITLIDMALKNDQDNVAELLLKASNNINAINEDGESFLHVALKNQCHLSIEFLLKAGANINARDKKGYTSFQYAARFGCHKWIIPLVDAGAYCLENDNEKCLKPLESAMLGLKAASLKIAQAHLFDDEKLRMEKGENDKINQLKVIEKLLEIGAGIYTSYKENLYFDDINTLDKLIVGLSCKVKSRGPHGLYDKNLSTIEIDRLLCQGKIDTQRLIKFCQLRLTKPEEEKNYEQLRKLLLQLKKSVTLLTLCVNKINSPLFSSKRNNLKKRIIDEEFPPYVVDKLI